jgi:hypothetical protein
MATCPAMTSRGPLQRMGRREYVNHLTEMFRVVGALSVVALSTPT